MKPVKFRGMVPQRRAAISEYPILAAGFGRDERRGEIVNCWRMNFLERLYVLLTGRVWVRVMTFRREIHPYALTVIKPYLRGEVRKGMKKAVKKQLKEEEKKQ